MILVENSPMKIITQLVIFSFLFLSSYAATEPVMSLITVNTEDTAGYRDWAKGSSEAIAKTNGASAVGLCSPRIGAEEMGDLYFWSLFAEMPPKVSINRSFYKVLCMTFPGARKPYFTIAFQ